MSECLELDTQARMQMDPHRADNWPGAFPAQAAAAEHCRTYSAADEAPAGGDFSGPQWTALRSVLQQIGAQA